MNNINLIPQLIALTQQRQELDNRINELLAMIQQGLSPEPEPKQEAQSGLLITAPQVSRLMAIATAHGWTDKEVKSLVSGKYGYESRKLIERDAYDSIIEEIEEREPSLEMIKQLGMELTNRGQLDQVKATIKAKGQADSARDVDPSRYAAVIIGLKKCLESQGDGKISVPQAIRLKELIKRQGITIEQILSEYGIRTMEDLMTPDWEELMLRFKDVPNDNLILLAQKQNVALGDFLLQNFGKRLPSQLTEVEKAEAISLLKGN